MLKELFEKNKNIIINTDIDGFLCGMILQKYYGCKVVGFSNSRETIWVSPEIDDIYQPIYIDLYVNRPDVVCIEQHIIAFDKEHHNKILDYATKINPNLERERTFCGDMQSDYYHKYPFGTVHYLIALMGREGINVELPDLNREYTYRDRKCSVGHIILRADDALYSTLSPYRSNALDWWKWLGKSNSTAIAQLKQFVDSCQIEKASAYKKSVGDFFKVLECDGADGAFSKVTNPDGDILEKVVVYNKMIGAMMNIELEIPSHYNIHKGEYKVSFCRPDTNMDILHTPELYSYAFIFGPRPKYPNFSYTLFMD